MKTHWTIIKWKGQEQIVYHLNGDTIDASDDEIDMCIKEQVFGDLK